MLMIKKMKISKINLGKTVRVRTKIDVSYACRFCFLAFKVFFGPIAVGHIIGYSSPALIDMKKQNVLVKSSHVALFASLLNIGGIIGCLLVGDLLDRLGRKYTLCISVFPVVIGYCLIASTTSMFWLLTGRIMTGLACGLTTTAASIYLVEIAPTSLRGVVGSLNQLGITIGIFISYLAGVWLSYSSLALLGAVLASCLILFTVVPGFPESPRYLVQMRDLTSASVNLAYLRPSHYDIQDELRDISSSVEQAVVLEEGGNTVDTPPKTESITDLLKKPELSRPLFVALGLMFFQQLSGVNVIMFYAQDILLKTGAVSSPGLGACLIGGGQVIFTIIAACLMDKFGRRQFLMLSSVIMTSSHVALSIFFFQHSNKGYIAVICLSLFIIGFSLGFGPVPFIIASEIFPTRVRSLANSIAICTSWIISFIITETFPSLQLLLGSGWVFLIFSFMCVLGLYFIWKFVPETQGKSLEDLELFFIGSRSSLRSL